MGEEDDSELADAIESLRDKHEELRKMVSERGVAYVEGALRRSGRAEEVEQRISKLLESARDGRDGGRSPKRNQGKSKGAKRGGHHNNDSQAKGRTRKASGKQYEWDEPAQKGSEEGGKQNSEQSKEAGSSSPRRYDDQEGKEEDSRGKKRKRILIEALEKPQEPRMSLSQVKLRLCEVEGRAAEMEGDAEEAIREKRRSGDALREAERTYKDVLARHRGRTSPVAARLMSCEAGQSLESKLEEVRARRWRAFVRRHCRPIVKELMYDPYGYIFNAPVDAEKLGLTDYHEIIKHPMDLGTVMSKIDSSRWYSPNDVAADVRLTFRNAIAYNPSEHVVHRAAVDLLDKFERNWSNRVEPYVAKANDDIECDVSVLREAHHKSQNERLNSLAASRVQSLLAAHQQAASSLAECKAQLQAMCRPLTESQIRSLSEQLSKLSQASIEHARQILLEDPNGPTEECLQANLSSLDTITLYRLQQLVCVSKYAAWERKGTPAISLFPSEDYPVDIASDSPDPPCHPSFSFNCRQK